MTVRPSPQIFPHFVNLSGFKAVRFEDCHLYFGLGTAPTRRNEEKNGERRSLKENVLVKEWSLFPKISM
jgi:hypothetical protein